MDYICKCIQTLLCFLQELGVMGEVSKNLAHTFRNSRGLAVQVAVLVSFAMRWCIGSYGLLPPFWQVMPIIISDCTLQILAGHVSDYVRLVRDGNMQHLSHCTVSYHWRRRQTSMLIECCILYRTSDIQHRIRRQNDIIRPIVRAIGKNSTKTYDVIRRGVRYRTFWRYCIWYHTSYHMTSYKMP